MSSSSSSSSDEDATSARPSMTPRIRSLLEERDKALQALETKSGKEGSSQQIKATAIRKKFDTEICCLVEGKGRLAVEECRVCAKSFLSSNDSYCDDCSHGCCPDCISNEYDYELGLVLNTCSDCSTLNIVGGINYYQSVADFRENDDDRSL